jgi:iron complex transport system substrate-binding protein
VESKVESKGTQYPITVKDASGTDVQFDKEPQRIVSISPAETEVLFALGLGEQVVGVTEWCDYPAEAKAKAKVGDMNSNMEAILALNPDVIIGGYTLNAEAVKKLRELGKRVFTVEPKTIDQVMERILQVGTITNRQAEAEKVVLSMKEKRQQVIDAVAQVTDAQKQKIYLEFDAMWTVGKGEFGDDLIRLSGAKNIARDKQGWVQINDEFIITQNPGVIIYASYTQDNAVGEAIKKRSGWSAIEAVKQNRVIGLDANMISRPGPRITDGLFEIAKGVYPELVK